MQVKLTASTAVNESIEPVGAVVEVDNATAARLINAGKAETLPGESLPEPVVVVTPVLDAEPAPVEPVFESIPTPTKAKRTRTAKKAARKE